MSTRVADRVDGWEQRSFSDGYRGLGDLADADFSGVVRAGGAELYMTKGTVVGIEGGSIEDFEGASGTSYRAPSPALPLLAVMQGRSDEVRAKYYTEDTPMAEVDRTLSEGGFTGYVELSENVLSGDYYLVYHQGRSMSVAFVGNSQQLIDGDEAFETANDEVGIYEVRPVEVAAVEIPEPEPEQDPSPDAGAAAGATGPATGGATEGADEDAADAERATADPDDRTGPGEPDPPAGEPGDVDTTAGADAGDSRDSGRAGAGQADQPGADQPGAGPAGSRDEPAGGSASEPSSAAAGDAPGKTGAQQGDTGAGGGETDAGRNREPAAGSAAGGSESGSPGRQPRESEPASDRETPEAGPGQGSAQRAQGEGETDGPAPGREPAPADADRAGASARGAGADEGRAGGPATQSDAGPAETEHQQEAGPSPGVAGGGPAERASEDAGVALETRSVPSLDPQRTSESGRGDTSTGTQQGPARQTPAGPSPEAEESASPGSGAGSDAEASPEAGSRSQAEPGGDQTQAGSGGSAGDRSGGPAGPEAGAGEGTSVDAATLRERLEDREAELDRLEAELAEETERREELERELAEVREERDELAAEVERLETELERVEEEFGVATGAGQRLTAAEALDGTDLFVRYQSKNGTTLTDAHDGNGRREDVTDNLRLEQHTQFDADDVAVDGKDYAAFIRGRVEYQFVTWLVEDLLFEVRDTGGAEGLADLYDALPEVDRAELNGTVAVRYTEDGTEQRGRETFDIVLRDRMGDPLFVVNLNDSREGATEGMMEGLITAAERVGGSKDTLAGAFLVTESFFEPEALETAAEATKGGLLSRDKRKSFVNLSRKRGYHLCLVEARNQNFNLAVPEL